MSIETHDAEAVKKAKGIAIIIDRKPRFATTTPLTGRELKELGEVKAEFDLFMVVAGPDNDRLIGDDESVDLKPGTRFISAPRELNPGDSTHAA